MCVVVTITLIIPRGHWVYMYIHWMYVIPGRTCQLLSSRSKLMIFGLPELEFLSPTPTPPIRLPVVFFISGFMVCFVLLLFGVIRQVKLPLPSRGLAVEVEASPV